MDKNRFFMWAYIIFIVTAAILRIHVEFSAWNPIVVGISISSVFFSAEDLCNRISKYYDKYFATNQNVIDKIKEKFEKSRESAQYAEHIVKICEDIELDLPDTFLRQHRIMAFR